MCQVFCKIVLDSSMELICFIPNNDEDNINRKVYPSIHLQLICICDDQMMICSLLAKHVGTEM